MARVDGCGLMGYWAHEYEIARQMELRVLAGLPSMICFVAGQIKIRWLQPWPVSVEYPQGHASATKPNLTTGSDTTGAISKNNF
jgi:hypothetical protein